MNPVETALLEESRPDTADTDATSLGASVIVPVKERPEPLPELYREYARPLREAGISHEFLFLVEPWARSLAGPLAALASQGEPIRVLEVGQTLGEAALVKLGAAHARSELVVTLPAYRRVEARELPELIRAAQDDADVVVARRWPRRDSWINRLQNRAFHSVIAGLSGDRIRDVACGVRVIRRQVVMDLPVYGDFHRFLPLFALREGYKVVELPAAQHPGDVRARVYGPGVYLRRILDVLGLFFLLRFTDKPLRFFGMVGSLVSAIGAGLLLVLFFQRIGGQPIAERPALLLSVLLLVLGIQAIALGLVGEIIVHLHAPTRKPYRVAADGSSEAPVTQVVEHHGNSGVLKKDNILTAAGTGRPEP